jgi:hypothetical protein
MNSKETATKSLKKRVEAVDKDLIEGGLIEAHNIMSALRAEADDATGKLKLYEKFFLDISLKLENRTSRERILTEMCDLVQKTREGLAKL